jgi:hypothetical protein
MAAVYSRRRYLANISSVISSPWSSPLEAALLQFKQDGLLARMRHASVMLYVLYLSIYVYSEDLSSWI